MSTLLNWFSSTAAQTLCLALLHSLWQGAAWCGLLLCLLSLTPRSRPQRRYLSALFCLGGLALGVLITWSILRLPQSAHALASPPAPSTFELAPAASTVSDEIRATPAARHSTAGPSLLPSTVVSWRQHSLTGLTAFWCLGVIFCFFRSLRDRTAAMQWKRGTHIHSAPTLQLLESLKKRMGIHGPVRIIASLQAAGPCVVGTFAPVILIPASLVSSLTPLEWTAILTHELAHIRRWDSLVNFGQQVLESFLFFNPAAHWISRQVRIEREACCDWWGAKLTASPVEYASTLVNIAERLASPRYRPAIAFADERSGSLLDRVKRLVAPKAEVGVRFSWLTSAALMLLSGGTLVVLVAGCDLTVSTAARYLTNEERVAEIAKVADVVAPESSALTEKVLISGTIQTEDGSPLSTPIQFTSTTKRGNSGTTGTLDTVTTDTFNVECPPGISWLFAGAEGYATTILGPFGEQGKTRYEDVVVTMKRGSSVLVRVVDPTGKPVPNIRVSRLDVVNGSGIGYASPSVTNTEGETELPHILAENQYSVTLKGPGYQEVNYRDYRLQPGNQIEFVISPASPASGVILNSTGLPVAGATIGRIRRRAPGWTDLTGQGEQPLATTDEHGHFTLAELLDGNAYDLLVQHPGYGPALLRNVHPGDEHLAATLAPRLHVQGTVHGTAEQLEALKKKHHSGSLLFDGLNQGADQELQFRLKLKLEWAEGKVSFHLDGLAPGELTLTIGGQVVRQKLTQSIDHFQFELQPNQAQSTRTVRIVFVENGKPVQPAGEMGLSIHSPNRSQQYDYISRSISDGVIQFEAPVPSKISSGNCKLIGFSLQDFQFDAQVQVGTDPLTIEVPVIPAGAVRGHVVERDGTPARNTSVFIHWELATRNGLTTSTRSGGQSSNSNATGEFVVSPIPFGAKCQLRASQEKRIILGPRFTLTERNAFPDFSLQFGDAVAATVRVVDPDGNPVRSVPLKVKLEHPDYNLDFGSAVFTDPNGDYRIEAINPELADYYSVTAIPERDYRPARVYLRPDEKTVVIQLQQGYILEGIVLGADGSPLSGREVSASPNKPPFWSFDLRPTTLTDTTGRFRLNNLPAQSMTLLIDGTSPRGPSSEFQPATVENVKPITLLAR